MFKAKMIYSLILVMVSSQMFSQTAPCNGLLPFEEKNGILTIEMESGILPSGSDWKTGSESDPNLPGSTVEYIYWDGVESFNLPSGAPITYNIKINNPGTYRFRWRARIGKGDSGGEHNDAWLKIVADDFYATSGSSSTSTPALEPQPSCNSNPNRSCPAGKSADGFFKAFMNRHPVKLPIEERWGFVTNTNDHSSYRYIWATFNAAGKYSIVVDARSSFLYIDKMVLRRTDVSDSVANNLNNPESTCSDENLSIGSENKLQSLSLYPNPTNGILSISNLNVDEDLIISNVYGALIRTIKNSKENQTIDISDLENGVYFISNGNGATRYSNKIIKM